MICDAHDDCVSQELPPDLKAVRDRLREMLEQGRTDEAVDLLIALLLKMRDENQGLTQRVAGLMRQLYGRRSEKVDPNQLALLLDQLKTPDEAAPPPPVPEPPKDDTPLPAPKPRPAHPGRKPLPANLPRERRELTPPASELECEECGQAKVRIGEEVSELLDYTPAQFKVLELVRPKFACKNPECTTAGVVIAPPADKVIAKGLPGPGLLAHVLVSKYQDSLPLNRLSGIYSRSGVDIKDSTLGDWVTAGAACLVRVAGEIRRRVLASYVLGLDDTGLSVLDRDAPNGVKKGHLWAHVGDDRWVVFEYTPTWASDGPKAFLAGRKGFIQGDGYAGYDKIVAERPNELVLAGCWAHARRKFVVAMESGDTRAAMAVDFIRKLYKVEREASDEGVGPMRLLGRRQLYSRPLVDQLYSWVAKTYPLATPKSPLGKALTYAVNQGPTLRVFLEDGQVPIDNNRVERALRTVAVGRKNYLFAGSDDGARRAAILYTVLGTARLAGVDPLAYLTDVLDRISLGWPGSRIAELLPDAWAARNRAEA